MDGELNIGTIPLSETTKFIVDNRGKTAPTVEYGIPLIATNCITNNRLYPAYENLRYVSEETYNTWFRSHPQPGDIILTNKGSQNGAICLVPDPTDFVIAQDMVALRANEKVIDPLFLFAALRSPDVQRQIKNLDVSGVIPHFKKTDFDKLFLPYPNRSIQEFIGRIYFDFCKKIELNRQMNETLEAMAKALFQSWFVDFDPVHAKAQGKKPEGMNDATAALFPDSFVESELGMIPKGWEATPLYDLAQWVNGAPFKNDEFCVSGTGLPVIKIAELKDGITGNTKWSNKTLSKNQTIETGDLVYSWSGSPDTSLDAFLWTNGTGLLNQHIFKVISKSKSDNRFMYYQLKNIRSILVEIARNKQTTGLGHVTIGDMKRLFVCKPSQIVLGEFEKFVAPVFNKAFSLRLESQELASLRDTLLPKLLSGELSTERANEQIGEMIHA
jgi:type I restriction enzyme S subunit